MKKAMILTAMMAASLGALAAADDALVSFSTRGPDVYADGAAVMDGECYALVWSADGVFEGITADGAAADAADRVVLVAPVAKGGRCPVTLFQIGAAEAAALKGGIFEVWLMDTRVRTADGTVTVARGVAETGAPMAVNGAARADAGGAAAVTAARADAGAGEIAGGAGVAVAGGVAAGAAATPVKVTAIRLAGANVVLTVRPAGAGVLSVQRGDATLGEFRTTGIAQEARGGAGAGEVELVVPKGDANRGFFRVMGM